MKRDTRPKRGWWAPGGYIRLCLKCNDPYCGDKRSSICADCAYAMPDLFQETPPKLQLDIQLTAEDRIQQLEDAIRKTLDENRHLADGDDCTLRELKKVLPTWN